MAQNYTRQSSMADGDTITAALFNNEYNQLVNAFAYSSSSASSTGHRHDGSTGQGGNVPQIGDLDFLNKVVVDGTNNRVGFFVEVSSSAVEQVRIQDGAIVPVTDNDIDLGTSSLEFKDGYFDGTVYADAINFNGTAITATAAELNIMDGVTSTAAEINLLDGVTATTTELNYVDTGASVGTVVASKVVTVDANKDVSSFRNITLTGELDAGSLDISGDADIDGTLETDALSINGTTVTATAAELNILDGVTSTAAELNILDGVTSTAAELNILDGVTSTAAEINIVDGDTSATSTTLADADRVVVNDSGTMVQVALTDFETYFESALDTLSNVTTVGALNSGSITSGFGAIDNGSSAITTTGTVTYGSLSDGSITVTAFVDEDNMSSNSATLIPTQQSVKAYVDSQVTAQDLDFQADSGGALSIDLDSETLTFTGGTGIDTSGSGNAVTFAIDSTVATLTGSQTLTNKSLTAPTLTGTAVVASLDISGDIDVDGTTNLDVVDIDGAVDMASTLQVTGNLTTSGNNTFTVTDNTAPLTLVSTDADANGGPFLDLWRNSANAADGDVTGVIRFYGENDNDEAIVYGKFLSFIRDASDGSEDGTIQINHIVAGTERVALELDNDEYVFNNAGIDIDFRVESTGNANMLLVDAGNDRIQIANLLLGEISSNVDIIQSTSSSGLLVDVTGDITLDADGGDFNFKDGGTTLLSLSNAGSNNVQFLTGISDGDLLFKGVDGGSVVTALTLDMSAAGAATFNSSITSGGNITVGGTNNLIINDSGAIVVGANNDVLISNTGSVFNEDGQDADFRVESNNQANMFGVNAGSDFVYVGTDEQSQGGALNVNAVSGSASLSLFTRSATDAHTGILTFLKTPATSGNYTATASGDVLGDIRFTGVNTSAVADIGAQILATQNGTSSSTVPTALKFISTEIEHLKLDGSVVFNEDGADLDFRIESDNNANMLVIDAGNNNVTVGHSSAGGATFAISDSGNATIQFFPEISTDTNLIQHYDLTAAAYMNAETRAASHSFKIGTSEAMRIDSSGNVLVGTTDTTLFNNTSGGGIGLMASNRLDVARAGDVVATFNRMTNDGSIIQFYAQGALEGSIDVSGNTVSLVGFSGAHASSGVDVTTAKGTVVSTIDQEHKNNHAKIKISDSEGDARVYGVIDRISEEGDIIVSGVGIGEVKVTGACAGGDLLESNGDGTAKVQSDDIIRSSTIGKVTIGNSDTGVKLVSCVLYCG